MVQIIRTHLIHQKKKVPLKRESFGKKSEMDTKLSIDEITNFEININCMPMEIRSINQAEGEPTTNYQAGEDLASIEITNINQSNADGQSDDESPTDDEKSASGMAKEDSSNSLDSIRLDNPKKTIDIQYLLSVSVAESVTAGALSNALCSEPGSSKFFLGGVIAYNMETQKNVLDVDAEYAERNNFANPFTTYIMAKNVTIMFQSRIGISTTGFSLPLYREPNLAQGKCEIDVKIPYAYICLYDTLIDKHRIIKVTNDNYSPSGNQRVQRAQMQVKIAIQCKKIFVEYCKSQRVKC